MTTSGLDPDLADALVTSLESTKGAQWCLLLVGGWLVLWTGYLAVKALVLVHAAVWGVPPPPRATRCAVRWCSRPASSCSSPPSGAHGGLGNTRWGWGWVQALHLFTAFYLSPKLHHATQLYGVLGIVATLLFWLYMTGRLVVAAATLNASLHEQHSLVADTTPLGLPDAPDPDLTTAGP